MICSDQPAEEPTDAAPQPEPPIVVVRPERRSDDDLPLSPSPPLSQDSVQPQQHVSPSETPRTTTELLGSVVKTLIGEDKKLTPTQVDKRLKEWENFYPLCRKTGQSYKQFRDGVMSMARQLGKLSLEEEENKTPQEVDKENRQGFPVLPRDNKPGQVDTNVETASPIDIDDPATSRWLQEHGLYEIVYPHDSSLDSEEDFIHQKGATPDNKYIIDMGVTPPYNHYPPGPDQDTPDGTRTLGAEYQLNMRQEAENWENEAISAPIPPRSQQSTKPGIAVAPSPSSAPSGKKMTLKEAIDFQLSLNPPQEKKSGQVHIDLVNIMHRSDADPATSNRVVEVGFPLGYENTNRHSINPDDFEKTVMRIPNTREDIDLPKWKDRCDHRTGCPAMVYRMVIDPNTGGQIRKLVVCEPSPFSSMEAAEAHWIAKHQTRVPHFKCPFCLMACHTHQCRVFKEHLMEQHLTEVMKACEPHSLHTDFNLGKVIDKWTNCYEALPACFGEKTLPVYWFANNQFMDPGKTQPPAEEYCKWNQDIVRGRNEEERYSKSLRYRNRHTINRWPANGSAWNNAISGKAPVPSLTPDARHITKLDIPARNPDFDKERQFCPDVIYTLNDNPLAPAYGFGWNCYCLRYNSKTDTLIKPPPQDPPVFGKFTQKPFPIAPPMYAANMQETDSTPDPARDPVPTGPGFMQYHDCYKLFCSESEVDDWTLQHDKKPWHINWAMYPAPDKFLSSEKVYQPRIHVARLHDDKPKPPPTRSPKNRFRYDVPNRPSISPLVLRNPPVAYNMASRQVTPVFYPPLAPRPGIVTQTSAIMVMSTPASLPGPSSDARKYSQDARINPPDPRITSEQVGRAIRQIYEHEGARPKELPRNQSCTPQPPIQNNDKQLRPNRITDVPSDPPPYTEDRQEFWSRDVELAPDNYNLKSAVPPPQHRVPSPSPIIPTEDWTSELVDTEQSQPVREPPEFQEHFNHPVGDITIEEPARTLHYRLNGVNVTPHPPNASPMIRLPAAVSMDGDIVVEDKQNRCAFQYRPAYRAKDGMICDPYDIQGHEHREAQGDRMLDFLFGGAKHFTLLLQQLAECRKNAKERAQALIVEAKKSNGKLQSVEKLLEQTENQAAIEKGELMSKIEKLENHISNLESELKEQKTLNQRLPPEQGIEIGNLKLAMSKLAEENSILRAKFNNANQANYALHTQNVNLMEQVKALNEKCKKTQDDRDYLRRDRDHYERESTKLNKDLYDLKQRFAQERKKFEKFD